MGLGRDCPARRGIFEKRKDRAKRRQRKLVYKDK
jgi:hypothetical protein